jgi:hypothetical protein
VVDDVDDVEDVEEVDDVEDVEEVDDVEEVEVEEELPPPDVAVLLPPVTPPLPLPPRMGSLESPAGTSSSSVLSISLCTRPLINANRAWLCSNRYVLNGLWAYCVVAGNE